MSLKKRLRVVWVMDMMLGVHGPMANVVVLRRRDEEQGVRESFILARNWWETFKPLLLAKAAEFEER